MTESPPYIQYRQIGDCYQLHGDYCIDVSAYIKPAWDIVGDWALLSKDGFLLVRHGYMWDGGSSPFAKLPVVGKWTKTKSTLRNSMLHDALFQLIRLGLLSPHFKGAADRILRDIGIKDGMYRWRADAWYDAVTAFGDPFIQRWAEPPLQTAP